MTDAQETRLRAVVQRDGRNFVELAAPEWCYSIPTADERYRVLVYVSPYDAHEIKKFYDLVLPRRKRRTASEVSIESCGRDKILAFVDRHFLRLGGVALPDGSEPALEQQRAWLDENPQFKGLIFETGFDRVGVRDGEDEPAPETRAIMILGRSEYRIRGGIRLWDEQQSCNVVIPLVHVLGRFSESERHQYDRAIKIIENSRRGEIYAEANWDVVGLLYQHHVQAIEGALLDGQPCTAANRDGESGWLARVPFIWQIFAMGRAISEVALGNA